MTSALRRRPAPPPRRHRGPRWVRAGCVVAVVALGASACSKPHAAAAPTMTLEVSQGSATVTGGGSTTTVTGRASIGIGDKVEVPQGDLAVLNLGAGRSFELTAGEALVTGSDRIQLSRGSALGNLQAPGEIDLEGLTVAAQSAVFRVISGEPARVAVFTGTASMRVPGNSLSVPAFGQAALSAGNLPATPRPMSVDNGGDVWDHRYLQDAIDLDDRLANFSGGLDAQLGTATGRDFFRVVLGDTAQAAYVAPFFAQPRSDVLIGLVITNSVAGSTHADPEAIFNQVMDQWVAGESWGLVALQDHVSAQDLFGGLLEAIRKVGISLQNPTANIVPLPTTTPKSKAPKPSPSPTAKPGARPGPATPSPSASPTPLLTQVLDPITNLVNELLNALLPQPPTSTPTPGGH